MNLTDIRTQLAAALDGYGFRCYPSIPEAAQLPCAVVQWPDTVTYNRSLGDLAEIEITITLAVAMTDWAAAQARIDAALSTDDNGLPYLIQQHDPDEAWRSAFVASAGNVARLQVAGNPALAADFTATIYA